MEGAWQHGCDSFIFILCNSLISALHDKGDTRINYNIFSGVKSAHTNYTLRLDVKMQSLDESGHCAWQHMCSSQCFSPCYLCTVDRAGENWLNKHPHTVRAQRLYHITWTEHLKTSISFSFHLFHSYLCMSAFLFLLTRLNFIQTGHH